MHIVNTIKAHTSAALQQIFQYTTNPDQVLVNETKPEFTGDYTIVLFAYIKPLKLSPDQIGEQIANYFLQNHADLFASFNVIKGFLNLTIQPAYWQQFLANNWQNVQFGFATPKQEKILVEYSSPNTNKPLHLGHLRNNFLGWGIAAILEANGYDVIKTCIVNDRGIHICKSMVAWLKLANGATPETTHTKGDHFVGKYYVLFNDLYKAEVESLIAAGHSRESAEKNAPILLEAQQMLVEWEAGNKEVIALWKKMNEWVYRGFDETYQKIGSDFQKIYYESETYILGKKLVEEGLAKKIFYTKEDGSVWIDLTADGLDEKIVQRKDGTSVYITQDIGLAEQREAEFHPSKTIYVVGDEQNYHFKVLKLICEKLGLPSAQQIYHLSYGMVELPHGKMKSREGTVVDADDIVAEMINIARQKTEELGKVNDFTPEELKQLYHTIGLGALKFFLLRVDPKKKMIFNPEESIDFHGFTGPFIQYTYARIKSILRKIDQQEALQNTSATSLQLSALEIELAKLLEQFPGFIADAANTLNPSVVAIYVFNLSKTFNSFYVDHPIAQETNPMQKQYRIQLATLTAHVIKTSLQLLGIQVPERM
ncbi:MAG: arginine--tRNA ligase [Sphingobacteriales bacterium]|uniref:arginine--tRNA ligase n=1 Tax=Hydrotalea flava TaxID=714549 RepID=UPI000831FC05|nr:arginine--tRNA ligase [Hydrotalea flava]RTL56754.1 MAG: arginine--tRNA ligase [Sphingobacteriales bacterium]